jgi:GntR family transcriptional regulator
MDFNDNKAIYQQIADMICNNILSGQWKGQARIPSVREIAVDLEVNPNTVVRSYNFLQEKDIIYNKRGIGYFVSSDGYETVLQMKKKEFLEDDVKKLFDKMKLLDISVNQLVEMYHKQSGKNKNQGS